MCAEIIAEELINPVGQSVETAFGYYLVTHAGRELSSDGSKFVAWIENDSDCEVCPHSTGCGAASQRLA